MDKLKVILIAGYGRSGSTFLGGLLGAVDGCFHVGELHQLWNRCFERNWACECGQTFRDCAFWRRFMTHFYAGQTFPKLMLKLECTRRWTAALVY